MTTIQLTAGEVAFVLGTGIVLGIFVGMGGATRKRRRPAKAGHGQAPRIHIVPTIEGSQRKGPRL